MKYILKFALANIFILFPRVLFLLGLLRKFYPRIQKSSLLILLLFSVCFVLSRDSSIVLPWLLLTLTNETKGMIYVEERRINRFLVDTTYLLILIASIFLRSNHLVLGIDKNILTIPLVLLILTHKSRHGLNTRSILLILGLSISIGSTNFLVFVMILILESVYHKVRKLKPKRNIRFFSLTVIYLLINLIALSYVLIGGLVFDINAPSIFFPGSIIERGLAVIETYDYLEINSITFFSGQFSKYIISVNPQIHNDFIKSLIQNGLVYWIAQNFVLLKFIQAYRFSRLEIVSLFLYNGILGILGWGYGTFYILGTLFIERLISRHEK